MLWHDLKQSILPWKTSNVAELKQFCKEEWAKIPPQWCEILTSTWLQLLLQRVAQPIIRFRGQLLFHIWSGRFGKLFSLNKRNHYFKTAFCIYMSYLCAILQFVWWSEYFKWQICKKKIRKGQNPFHGTLLRHPCLSPWKLHNLHNVWILNKETHLSSLTAFKSNKNTIYSTCPTVAVPTVRRKSQLKNVYYVQLSECFLQVDLCHPERNWASLILRVWRRWESENRQNPCWAVRQEHQIYTDGLCLQCLHTLSAPLLQSHTQKQCIQVRNKNKQAKANTDEKYMLMTLSRTEPDLKLSLHIVSPGLDFSSATIRMKGHCVTSKVGMILFHLQAVYEL